MYLCLLFLLFQYPHFIMTTANEISPQQIHLALGHSPDYMTLQWATYDQYCTTSSRVKYGTNLKNVDFFEIINGECFKFDLGYNEVDVRDQLLQSHHVTKLINLKPSTKYFYQILGNSTSEEISDVFYFISSPNAITLKDHLPHRFLIFGDLASSNSPPTNSSTIMPWISPECQNLDYDLAIQLGDFAYDFSRLNGVVGRTFMEEIQNFTAYVPLHVNFGNHEVRYDYAHATEFFRNMPSNQDHTTVVTFNGEAPNNWFYSWNYGLVHFITILSEIYWDHPELIQTQLNWLEQDLIKANNNRSEAPWIIVNGHRSMYCSCDGDCDSDAARLRSGFPVGGNSNNGIESLLYKYGVDLYLNGHEHNYERMWDIAPNETLDYLAGITTQSTINPPATIYIVVGNAGNYEDHETFQLPKPITSAYRNSDYGYCRMNVYNETHLYWEFIETDLSVTPQIVGQVMDSFWLIQEYHGSFLNR